MKTDLSYLKEMSAGNEDLMNEMISIFKEQIQEFRPQMTSLYEQEDYDKLAKLFHKAKSSVSIMGLTELGAELKQFELDTASGKGLERIPSFLEKFNTETRLAVEELNEFQNRK